ncbi:hypothetical protein NMG60_11004420 [Bertholletia excelsa]
MRGSATEKLDRKTVEKNRRIHMKGLCFKLTSLIPSHHFRPSKEMLSQQDQLDQAAAYINKLKERVELLKARKAALARRHDENNMNNCRSNMASGVKLPMIELKDLGSGLEVVVVTGLRKKFMLYEVISILQNEGAEVVSASVTTKGDKVYHTLHAQVRISRVGVESSKIYERLKELVCDSTSSLS